MLLDGTRAARVVDLTAEQPNPPLFKDAPTHRLVPERATGRRVVARRDPRTVDGVCLHQTGVEYGVMASAVRAAGGDAVLAKHRRALQVAAHMTVFDTGYAVLASPLDWYVYHGNALNARTIGIEIEGVFPEKQGDLSLLGDDQVQAARDGLEFVVRRGREQGMPLKYAFAHRQAATNRAADPGEEIWRKLVLEYGIPVLGLRSLPTATFGGSPLPMEWRMR